MAFSRVIYEKSQVYLSRRMSSHQPVFESKATYYNSSSRKWNLGMFTLNENNFQFKSDDDSQNLSIPLSTISGIEKKQSSFVYAAVVISVGAEKHWFASFPNRDTIYNLLELFWRQSLFSTSIKATSPQPRTGGTALGKELLGILHESECTLVEAANTLVSQGRQIQESQMVLEDINSDLDDAAKYLKNMSLPGVLTNVVETESKTKVEKMENMATAQKLFDVTYSFSKTSSDSNKWEKGTLIISETIVLLDEDKNRKMAVDSHELDKFQVISPWELCIAYSSNRTQNFCYVMCPQLSGLLKFLNSLPALKMKLSLNEDNVLSDNGSCSNPSFSGHTQSFRPHAVTHETEAPFAQSQAEACVTDEDIEEISTVLNNLQALATEVGREQQNQMEKINSLITDVDKTELRINASNKNIKKAS